MLKMFDTIVVIILAMPLYGVLIWSYFYSQESLLWGKRWMYKEEPQIADGAIRYIKVVIFHQYYRIDASFHYFNTNSI